MAGIIDCQSHLYPPALLDRLEQRRSEPLLYRRNGDRYVQVGDWHRRVFPRHSEVGATLAAMDAHGIELTVLSTNDPGPERFGADAPAVARLCNDFIADAVRRHPGRFVGLAVVPAPEQDATAAMAELDRCGQQPGMKGILLYTNYAGRFPDAPEFWPLFARAEQLEMPVLLHPAKPLATAGLHDCEMIAALGNMFEDTIALARLILAGVLDEFPRLQLVCPHLGGTLPYLIGRLDHQTQVLKRGPATLRRAPSEYLRQVWFDVASPLPQAIRFAYELVGPDRLLFASDYPWVQPDVILSALRGARLPPEHCEQILHHNARRLFKL